MESSSTVLHDAFVMHAPEVYRLVRAIVGSPASAEDVTQEAFMRAFENLDRYDPARPIRPWLVTIAVRLALDHTRRERIRRAASLTARFADMVRPVLGSTDTRMDVDAALRTLAPKERAVIVARHYLGMSYLEIAESVGISEANVGTTLHRAHERMRRVLSPNRSVDVESQSHADRPNARRY